MELFCRVRRVSRPQSVFAFVRPIAVIAKSAASPCFPGTWRLECLSFDLDRKTNTFMLQYRQALASDMPRIVHLHVETSREAYANILPEDYLQGVLLAEKRTLWQKRFTVSPSDHTIFVATDGLDIVGLCCFLFNEQMQFGTYLHNLYVRPAFQGRGVASSLLREAIATFDDLRKVEPIHLLVYAMNMKAVAVYDRLGGIVVEKCEVLRAGSAVELLRYQWPSAIELVANAGGRGDANAK